MWEPEVSEEAAPPAIQNAVDDDGQLVEDAQPSDIEPSGGEEEDPEPLSSNEQPVSIMPSPSELEHKELQLEDKQVQLEQLS